MKNDDKPFDPMPADVLAKLPTICAAYLRGSGDPGQPIWIKKGVRGYYPALPDLDVDAINAGFGVTRAQRLAMECGSMFGWGVPGADPDLWAAKEKEAAQKKD